MAQSPSIFSTVVVFVGSAVAFAGHALQSSGVDYSNPVPSPASLPSYSAEANRRPVSSAEAPGSISEVGPSSTRPAPFIPSPRELANRDLPTRESSGRESSARESSGRESARPQTPTTPTPTTPGPTTSAAADASHIDSITRRAVALQIALERSGFSPGLIDGAPGPKTQLALDEFAAAHGLPKATLISGTSPRLPDATAEALRLPETNSFTTYRITENDLAHISGPTPATWLGKSQATALDYETLTDLLAERFHTTERFLARLNPSAAIDALTAGSVVIVPAADAPKLPRVAKLIINLDGKTIRGYDDADRQVLLLHCSIARVATKRPSRDSSVAVIAENPDYTFDPARWPEVNENITRKLRLPPGPRNPVGSTWIGLELPGYGIHGTPTPELIGKTGSAGCIRLPNWDARRLAFAVRIGTPVIFD